MVQEPSFWVSMDCIHELIALMLICKCKDSDQSFRFCYPYVACRGAQQLFLVTSTFSLIKMTHPTLQFYVLYKNDRIVGLMEAVIETHKIPKGQTPQFHVQCSLKLAIYNVNYKMHDNPSCKNSHWYHRACKLNLTWLEIGSPNMKVGLQMVANKFDKVIQPFREILSLV